MGVVAVIEAVVFDVGGVFFHQPTALTDAVARSHGITGDVLVERLFGGQIWDDHKRGKTTEDEYWAEIVDGLPASFDGRVEALRERVDRAILLDDALVAVIRRLRPDCRIAALSNAGGELERRLAHFGLSPLLPTVINSHRVGMAKPDPEIYLYTAEVLHVAPEQILFVDDRTRNTLAAEQIGFRTHVYTDASRCAAVLRTVGLLTDAAM